MHETMREIAIVGQEEQAFAVLVESADGVYTLSDLRHQVDGERTAGRIVVRAQEAARLVDEPVDELLGTHRFAVEGHLLLRRDARAQFGDDIAVDRDAASTNELVALT